MKTSKLNKFIDQYLFKPKDGFFELPYLSNSPEVLINGLINLPVTKHLIQKKAVSTDNPFCKGIVYYREIEDGLWILSYEMDIRQNVVAKAIYDENESSDYYFLTFSVFEYEFPSFEHPGKSITLLSKCWTLYKPKTKVAMYFYKQTSGRFVNMVFNKKWAEKHLTPEILDNAQDLQNFLDEKTGYLTWLDVVPEAQSTFDEICSIAKDTPNDGNKNEIKSRILDLFASFFNATHSDNRIKNYRSLFDADYGIAGCAEKMVLHNLNGPFVGIEQIAAQVNMSPTKLKIIFKSVFGQSMLQYRKEKNWLLAEQLLKVPIIQIKNIASITGFESASKFANSFKLRFGKLPSVFRDEFID